MVKKATRTKRPPFPAAAVARHCAMLAAFGKLTGGLAYENS